MILLIAQYLDLSILEFSTMWHKYSVIILIGIISQLSMHGFTLNVFGNSLFSDPGIKLSNYNFQSISIS